MVPIPDISDQVQHDVHLEDQQLPVYQTTSSNLPSDLTAADARTAASSSPDTVDESMPTRPCPPSHASNTPPNDRVTSSVRGPPTRKRNSWSSFLPFIPSRSAKKVRHSITLIVCHLVCPPSDPSTGRLNPDEVLASAAEDCALHRLSLSTILQDISIAEHTPMYWAVVDYREELLVALLKHGQPLVAHTISDIRRACLISSNQALFHALRVRRPPFHGTDGLQLRSLHAASDALLLGNLPADEVHLEQSGDGAFVATFDIRLWQRRLRGVGKVSVEFIVSGRMWSITFIYPSLSSSFSMGGISIGRESSLHVLISLMESSPSTYLDSTLIFEVPHPRIIHEAGSKQREKRSSMYNHTPPLTLHLRSGSWKLSCGSQTKGTSKVSAVESLGQVTRWQEGFGSYVVKRTDSVVSPLGRDIESHLLYENSRYLFPDGTLRARLEASLSEE
ncbi:hypothetical protein PAXRUDRAFT_143926 [Paxillus rubicundulus Ve08.2h10]|uniref:Uncharacterized protein n=1 Tax=Paxillus rubicundulus Ve08.2h10 TaxID=930991 RepID=A0A0D0E7G5_9AGAM|nr:hypothetical protein PAXRUDRAFT_143926 [Paxillus rubicundulus Ve08.2h10]